MEPSLFPEVPEERERFGAGLIHAQTWILHPSCFAEIELKFIQALGASPEPSTSRDLAFRVWNKPEGYAAVPMLLKLQKNGLVSKINGKPLQWKLTEDGQAVLKSL